MPIHPTAVVHDAAEIDASADIGPFCTIGPHAKIGPETRLISHVSVQNRTSVGSRCVIHPFASLGGAPQDLKFRGEPARLVIGDDNVIRESVTLNIGTELGTMETRVGQGCLLMAYSHVAHDCVLGNGVILANCASLAGHVELADRTIMAGMAAVHQFVRVGPNGFIAGGAMVTQDVPPFCIAQGDRAQLMGINVVGLKRAGWTREALGRVREAFKALFQTPATRREALEEVERALAPHSDEVKAMCAFIRESKRGVCQARSNGSDNREI